MRWFAAAVLALACTYGGYAADFPGTGPLATAAQLIAAHGTGSGVVLRVEYRSAVPDDVTMTAEIARGYVFVRQVRAGNPDTAVLHDYVLRRVIEIDGAHRSFTNVSMYAMADFRFAEAYNRRVIRDALRAVGVKSPMHPYFDQQDLGIASPQDGQVEFGREKTAGGGLRFVVDGKTGAAYEPSQESLSQDDMRGVMRFLRSAFSLHPELLAAIAAGGKLPREIVAVEGHPDQRRERTWILVSVERAQGAYPLPPDYQPNTSFPKSPPVLKALLPLMLEAVAGRAQGGPRSLASYRAAMSEALARGNMLQHFLLDNEMNLQYRSGTMACLNGNVLREDCSHQQDIVQRWKADPETMKLVQSFGLERQNPEQAIAQRNSVPRAGLTDAYMIDLWNGDTMMQSGKGGDPVPLFEAAINGNPYIGGFYKDLGDAYRFGFQPLDAWLCYDLARALPGGPSVPVVDGIDKMEAMIASRTPEFF